MKRRNRIDRKDIGRSLLLGLAIALASASPAAADLGLTGEFRFEGYRENQEQNGTPGTFNLMEGIAVDHAGAAGASPGDLYVANRQVQFSPGTSEVQAISSNGVFDRGWLTSPGGGDIALDQATGSIFQWTAQRAITEYSPGGAFIRSFGFDVVASGPDDSSVDEQREVTVIASGGTYTLSARTLSGAVLTTKPIDFDASSSALQAALDELQGVDVIVTGGPGDATGSNPYLLTFTGDLGGDDVADFFISAQTSENLTGGAAVVRARTIVEGGAREVCLPLDVCKEGSSSSATGLGSRTQLGGMLINGKLALAPPLAPNGGNLLMRQEVENPRVDEFTPDGHFVRAFGWDVVDHGPGDSSVDEQQKVSLGGNTTGGKFSLSFEGQTTGAAGNGDLANGSATVSNLSTENGNFAVGQKVIGKGISPNTTILAAGSGTMTLSQPASLTVQGGTLSASDLDYNASAVAVEAALNALPSIGGAGGSVSVSGPSGGPYTAAFGGTKGGDKLRKLTADPIGLTVSSGESGVTVSTVVEGGAFETCVDAAGDVCKEGVSGAKVGQSLGAGGIAEDSTGAIYVAEKGTEGNSEKSNQRVQKLTPAGSTYIPSVFGGPGAPSGTSSANQPVDVAIDYADHVFVTKNYPAGAAVCPADGSPSLPEQRVQEFDPAGNLLDVSSPCLLAVGRGAEGNKSATFESDLEVDPVSGEPYLMFGQGGEEQPHDLVYVFGDIGDQPELSLVPPSNVSARGVTISGQVTAHGPVVAAPHPNPNSTKYRVELRKQGDLDWDIYAPPTSVGTSDSPTPFTVGVSGLTPNTPYEIRVIAAKVGFPDVVGPTQTIVTDGAPPAIASLASSDVSAAAATLHAGINPLGLPTTYHFEYGKTVQYGQRTPESVVGSSLAVVEVESQIDELEPVTYHFRVLATNALGTTTSGDQTFTFYPESCPNNTTRQQTGAGRLPDCRAYELVSPGEAGTAILTAGGPSSALARNPSRMSFQGFLGTIPGPWNPASQLGSNYVATRTPSGWRSAYVGIPADVATLTGGAPLQGGYSSTTAASGGGFLFADLSLGKTLTWELGKSFFLPTGVAFGSFAPYVYDAEGNSLGRYPTNLAQIPGGTDDASDGGFVGAPLPSPDFSHYFFSSANVAFVPGGLTSEGGSVYDNDIEAGTVTIASKTPSGADIPREPGNLSDDFKALPAASRDGSHLLIASTGTGICGKATCFEPIGLICGAGESPGMSGADCPRNIPAHLYMRVDGAVTYDVSIGRVVTFQGMTADGSKVYFTSGEQVTSEDHDQSIDLYRWRESTDEVTLVSDIPGLIGDTDNCNASWIGGCGVEVVELRGGTLGTPRRQEGEGIATRAVPTDNAIAADSGDVYFYSPEQFVGAEGVPGRRNLYVLREGQVRYVATLDAGTPLLRIQVSPDGAHAAFLTATRLTEYDNTSPTGVCTTNGGVAVSGPRCLEMYSYDVDADDLSCVSCPPLGAAPPTSDVSGSQNGLFMADDGRTFFSTGYPLDPQDTNGIVDAYEYTDGKAQLISTGTGSIERGRLGGAGLVGVSADGVDVYFATFEGLVPEDHNAQYLRFYDARTNGGFPITVQGAPCEAAEECRGPGSQTLPAPGVTSTADLGRRGNLPQKKRKRAKGKAKKKRHAKHQKKRSQHAHRGAAPKGGSR